MRMFNKQLLVEGNDDMHVIMALCQKFTVAQNFEIIDCKAPTGSKVIIKLKKNINYEKIKIQLYRHRR